MNKVIIEYDNCKKCQYLDHNGLLQATTYYVCRKSPIEGGGCKKITQYPTETIPIPDWCPLLKKELDTKRHLCMSCKKDYPECEAEDRDIKFGDGVGNDNICDCYYYEEEGE